MINNSDNKETTKSIEKYEEDNKFNNKSNSMDIRRKKVMVIAAHPDDEILGVGGAILKHVEKGDEVHVCIVTNS